MKKILMFLFILLDLVSFGQPISQVNYVIPAGGASITAYQCSQYTGDNLTCGLYNVSAAAATNLGAFTYTLAFSGTPTQGAHWDLYLDFTNLTYNNANQLTFFGEQPLVKYPGILKYYIHFWVNSSAAIVATYSAPPFTGAYLLPTLTVTGATNLRGTVYDQFLFTDAYRARFAGIGVASDSSQKLTCSPWLLCGNAGTNVDSDFIGTTDNVDLRFKVNNQKAGLLDIAGLNTGFGYQSLNISTGTSNAAFGYQSLKVNTTGSANTGIGAGALITNTTGSENTAVGQGAITFTTTGSHNTAIGYGALPANTTGSGNTALGDQSLNTNTTGINNTAVGYQAQFNGTGFSNSIALGANSLVTGSNILAIAPAVRSISFTGHSTGVGYGLRDSSGDGTTWIPMPNVNTQTLFTPLTGDSITITTQANIIVPAGTIANLTIQLPASPFNGQVENFSFTQVVSAMHWSTALNQANNVVATVPTAATPAGYVFSIQFNTATSKWYNY